MSLSELLNSKISKLSYWRYWVFLASLILSFVLYGNTLGHDYTQDDAIVIYDNMFTQEGVQGIPGLLRNDTFYGFFKEEGKANLVSGGRYRPLTPIMFALEYHFFGRSPFMGHLFNVFYFGLLIFIIYLVSNQLLKETLPDDAQLIAIITAIVFAMHPIHTEAVANIKGRDEIMSLLFSLMALHLSNKYIDQKKLSFLMGAGLVFFLGLLSKENTITFLFVIPLGILMFRNIPFAKILKTVSPLLIATIAFLIIRTKILGFDFGSQPYELMNNPFLKMVDGNYIPYGFSEKLATIVFTLGKYLQLLFFPHPLTHDYYPRHIELMNFGNASVWLSVIMYAVLVSAAFLFRKKNGVIAFAIFYFLITLSIVSNLVFPIGTNMSERFLFMPSFGFCLVVGLAFNQLSKLNSSRLPFLIFGALGILLSAKTISRNMVWKDDLTLFTSDIVTSKNSAKLNNAVGGALTNQSYEIENEAKRKETLRKAITYLDKAISVHPLYKNPYLIKGNCHHLLGEYDEAKQSYDMALNIDPGYQEARENIAINYREQGKDFGANKGDLVNAIKYLELANQIAPDDYETLRLLGIAHGNGQDHQKAISYFHRALELSPQTAAAAVNLAKAYQNSGDKSKAEDYFRLAIELDPNALNE